MADPFNVGMIGCGGIANRHAGVLSKLEAVNLVAFCDIAEDRATGFNEQYAESREQIPRMRNQVASIWQCWRTRQIDLTKNTALAICGAA